MATVGAWEFLEIADEVRPVDAVGNVGDLATPAGLTTPSVVQGRFGRAREFGDLKAFAAADAVVDSTLLARDATLFSFVTFEIANFIDTDVGVVLLRHGGSNAIAFAVELERVSAVSVRIRAFWEGPGASSTVGVTFEWPNAEFMIGVVRTWNSATDVDVDYFVNGVLIGSENVAEGAIAPDTGGLLALGYNAVTATDFLPDDSIIDFLQLESDAVPAEEMRQLYRRVAVHQPNGYRILRAFLPPGSAWNRDPDSNVQKWIAAEGDALGLEVADIERFREDFLPDRAYGGALEDWERITGQVPKGSDTIAQRRARVLGFLRVVLGFPVEEIKTALEPLFGLDAVDIEIIEFTGLREDDFTLDDIGTPPSRMWRTFQGNGTVAVDTPTPECDVDFGAGVDARYEFKGAPYRETGLSALLGETVDGATLAIEFATGATGVDVLAGVFMRNVGDDDVLFWGAFGVAEDLGHYRIVGGVPSAITLIVAAAGVPQTLAMRYNGAGLYDLGRIVAGVFTVDAADVVGPVAPRWAGFGAFERIATGTAFAGSFRDAQVFEKSSPRGFTYLAIRNPALPGAFDIDAAQAQLNRQSPAHVNAVAATTDQGFELGPTGLGKLGSSPLFPKI